MPNMNIKHKNAVKRLSLHLGKEFIVNIIAY